MIFEQEKLDKLWTLITNGTSSKAPDEMVNRIKVRSESLQKRIDRLPKGSAIRQKLESA